MGIPGTAVKRRHWSRVAAEPGSPLLGSVSTPGFALLVEAASNSKRRLHQEHASDLASQSEYSFPLPTPIESGAFLKAQLGGNKVQPQSPLQTELPRAGGNWKERVQTTGPSQAVGRRPAVLDLLIVEGARQGNESKTCLGADPAGSWRQVGRILKQHRQPILGRLKVPDAQRQN